MTIKKIKIFAKNKKEVAVGAGTTAAGLGLVVGGRHSGNTITRKLVESFRDGYGDLTKVADNNKIYDKLLKEAKKQGTRVYEEPGFDNSAYTGSKMGKRVKDAIAMAEKKLKKLDGGREAIRNLNTTINNSPEVGSIFKHVGKDRIVIGGNDTRTASTLSHELGHSRYMRSGRSKSVVGKAAHKLIPLSSISSSKLGTLGHLVNGVHSGLKEEKNKSEGKKTSKWTKAKASVVPAALAAPLLIAEGKASLNGLKTMKKLGASKELLKQSRKDLGKAWGTYGGQALKGVAIGEGSRWIGKGIGKIKYSKDEDNSK